MKQEIYDRSPLLCKNCGGTVSYKSYRDKAVFCGRSCAASFNNKGKIKSKETKELLSVSLKNYHDNHIKIKINKPIRIITDVCLKCNKLFTYRKGKIRKYCSAECWNSLSGGYKEKSGSRKQGWCRGIYCNSSWEAAFVVYNKDNHIDIQRYQGYYPYYDPIENRDTKYFPDFIIDNKLIEIKGVKSYKDKLKLASVNDREISILYKKDLSECFSYIRSKYKTQKFEELFDGYKPSKHYVCDFCNSEFITDVKRNNGLKFCNTSCSARYRHLNKLVQ